jgi:hypothetical protein
MRVTWLDKVRAMSLDDLYMVDTWPGDEPVPPHPLWQSPFVLAPAGETWERIVARVRRAGELWLINQDLRPYNELVIAHASDPWFMAFQRAARPDEGHLLIGPYERRVLSPADATPVATLPLIYRESRDATSRELWRRLARPA